MTEFLSPNISTYVYALYSVAFIIICFLSGQKLIFLVCEAAWSAEPV
jgi:hypothetical protein